MHYSRPAFSFYFAGYANSYADRNFDTPGCLDTPLAVICLFLRAEAGIQSLEKLYKIFSLKSGNNSEFSLSNLSFLSHYSPFFMPPTFHSILVHLPSGV
jgi:hypothetical protein